MTDNELREYLRERLGYEPTPPFDRAAAKREIWAVYVCIVVLIALCLWALW